MANRNELVYLMIRMMDNYDAIHHTALSKQVKKIEDDYIHPTPLIEKILS